MEQDSHHLPTVWTYTFGMWEEQCKLLAEDEDRLKFTKTDNEIRELCAQKDKFFQVDQLLFAAPLAKVLAQTVTTKESRLLGLQAAKTRWKYSIDNDPLENTVDSNTRPAITRNNPLKQPKQTKKLPNGKQRQRGRNRHDQSNFQHHTTSHYPHHALTTSTHSFASALFVYVTFIQCLLSISCCSSFGIQI